MRKPNYYKEALHLMDSLYKKYPELPLGRHLSTALVDYGDFWGITNKEFCFALEKYISELELDNLNLSSEVYIEKIVEDANKLFSEPIEEEEED